MNIRSVLGEGFHGITLVVGVLCGLAALHTTITPVFLLAGILVVGAGFYAPTLVIGLVFAGIALDTTGRIGINIAGLPLTASKVATVVAFGVYIVHAVMRGKQLVRFSWVLLGFGGIVGTMMASVVVSGMLGPAYRYIASVIMLTALTALVSSAVEEEHLPHLIRFMAVIMIAVMAWNLNQDHSAVVMRLDHAWQERSAGAFGDPNFWAAFLVLSCPMILGGLITDENPAARGLLFLVAVLYPASVIQSYSRAGLIGMILTVPFLLYIFRKQWQYIVVAFLLIIPIVPFVVNLEAALLRYGTLFDPTREAELGYASLSERTELLKAGLFLIQQHGLHGIGVGMFPAYASYVTAGGVWKVAHNTYVTIWVEQGVLGVFSHILLFVAIAHTGWRAAFKTERSTLQNIGTGFMGGIVGVGFMAVTLNMMDFAIIYFCLGLAIAIEGTTHRAPEPELSLRPALEVR